MRSTVCTLFEGNYHYGVAGLINSLAANNFKGNIFAGFRGQLPKWCTNTEDLAKNSDGIVKHQIKNDLCLHIMPVQTDMHLSNYKPNFMLELLSGPASNTDALYYFDPDIVVDTSWDYFDDAIKCGVLLCEDVNSPVSEFHPRRVGWRIFFEKHGFQLVYKSPYYVNGGFVGILPKEKGFLETWLSLQEKVFTEIGGGNRTSVPGGDALTSSKGFADCFSIPDQDALNAAVEAFPGQVSILGQEVMAFKPGLAILPHAIGSRKPWNSKYLLNFLNGFPPRKVDKIFWQNIPGPVRVYSRTKIVTQRMSILLASLLGRGYRRG